MIVISNSVVFGLWLKSILSLFASGVLLVEISKEG